MNENIIELRIKEIREETSSCKSFVLTEKAGTLRYSAGQFLTLVFPEKLNENRRSYSISSSAKLNEPLTITVKRVDNGEFSRLLFDWSRVGDSLYTIGASGLFTLPEKDEPYDHLFFFAAGSGITPMLPMIKEVLSFRKNLRMTLVYSNPSRHETIFYEELTKLEQDNPEQLHIEWLFSDVQNLLKARLSKTSVQEYVEAMSPSERKRTLFYLCGPDDYMQMITITLLREGVDSSAIRKEIFNATKPVIKEVPPDQEEHEIAVKYKGKTSRYKTKYPVSILEGAKREGIFLPYSCEAGKCGTCAATCVNGSVWMAYNEVLLDRELNEGRVLTCTGFPIGGDIVLEFPEAGE